MRELILNDASLRCPGSDRSQVTSYLLEVVLGIRALASERVVEPELRMRPASAAIECLPGRTLAESILDLRKTGHRDASVYLLRLTTKAAWLGGLPLPVRERFRSCEGRGLPPGDEAPLMLCVVTGAIAVGFPSADLWNTDRVTIRFDELLPGAEIRDCAEEVDILTRPGQATAIAERHRAALRAGADPEELWRRRCEAFPHLRFGPGVDANLSRLGGHLLGVAEKLSGLDAAAAEWQESGSDAPRWRTKVTGESERLRKNPKLLDRRRFPSRTGERELFEWHARYGSGGRIHLRLEPVSREVEIGYIGPHLPL